VRQAVGASVDGAPTRTITEQEVRDAFVSKPTRINQTVADRLMKADHKALSADDVFAKAIKARDPKVEVATLDLAGQAQKPVYAMGDRMAVLTPTGLQELPPGLSQELGSHKLDWHAMKTFDPTPSVRQAVGANIDGAPTRTITEQEVRDAFVSKPARINQTIADRLMKADHKALSADDPFAKAIKARDPKIEVATLDLAGQAQKPVYAMDGRMAILTPTGLQELPPGLTQELGSHKLDWHALKLPPVADTGAVAAAATAAPEAATAAPAANPSGGGILGWIKKLRGAKGELKANATPPEVEQLRTGLDTLKGMAKTPEQQSAIRDVTDWFAKNGTTQDLMKMATSLKNKAGELVPTTRSEMGLLRRTLERLKPSRDPNAQGLVKTIGGFFQRRTDNLKSIGTALRDKAGKLVPL
jgi:NADH/NAD ratio-sensing transcriptional regulator Rex